MIFIGPETPRLRETLQGKAGIGPGRPGQPEVTAAGVNARPTIPRKWLPGKWTLPRAFRSRFRLPFALYCRAGDFARRGTLRPAGSSAGRCKAGACRVVLRRGRAPALTPALRAGEPSKRRLRAAVNLIGPETLRQPEDLRDKAGIGSGRPRQPEVTAAKDRTSISLFHPITGNTQRVARMMPNVTAQNTAQSTSVRPNFSTFSRVRPAPPR